MTPKLLDALISGRKVFIYNRPSDGHIYASEHDYERFGVTPITTFRVPLTENWNVETCPVVARKLAKARRS